MRTYNVSPLQGSSNIHTPTQGSTLGYGLKDGLSALCVERMTMHTKNNP